jgi:mycothiol synthase
MVAAREDVRGKGLGLPVCAAAINKHINEGQKDCLLTTHDWRLGGIKHYIKLGFLPVLNHESMRGRWEIILKTLKISTIKCVNDDLTPAEDIISA